MTMNIFTAISSILTALVSTVVKACGAVDTSVSALDNVAKMAEHTTSAMLVEQQEEASQALEELKAQRKTAQ